MKLFDGWSNIEFADAVSLLSIKFCANEHYNESIKSAILIEQ